MRTRHVAVEKAWNTWVAEYPAQFSHLPSGFHLAICAYSDRLQSFTRFPAGESVRLGPRAIDGSFGDLTLTHGGTTLDVTFDKPHPFQLRGGWETRESGEWGLRFWVLLCAFFTPAPDEDAPSLVWDPETQRLVGRRDELEIIVEGGAPPLLVSFHDDLDAVAAEFHRYGYFYKGSSGVAGPLAVLRYNLEEMPSHKFSATVQSPAAHPFIASPFIPSPSIPLGGAQEGLGEGAVRSRQRSGHQRSARSDGPSTVHDVEFALHTVRDVIGWNTVWDFVNGRPYTTASRNWVAQKFGGWGLWLNDMLYHALLASPFDPELARDNLKAMLSGQTPEGNLPCLLTGRDAWVDRSQPPIASFILRMIGMRTGERSLLETYYPTLVRNHRWWRRARDGNGNGLFEYGSSPVGSGLYQGTKLAAKDESHMDNSPVHDEATFIPDRGTLDCEDVGLNSLLALDGDMLADIALELGRADEAAAFRAEADALKQRIAAELWDPERQVFANRLWSGRFVRSLAPTSFYPLLAGAATEEQARLLVDKHLLNDEAFWGDYPLPSVSKQDPTFHDNVYWRGRVWPPLNFLVYHGLRRYRLHEEAGELARKSLALFRKEWEARRHAHENWNAVTGAGCDEGDSDTFYAWSALMPWLTLAEWMDWTPWEGWSVAHGNAALEQTCGPVWSGAGLCTTRVEAGWFHVNLDGRTVFRTNIRGRFTHVEVQPHLLSMSLPLGDNVPSGHTAADESAPGQHHPVIELPGYSRAQLIAATLNGRPLPVDNASNGVIRITLPRQLGAASNALRGTDIRRSDHGRAILRIYLDN